MCPCSAASLQAENLFSAIEIFMLSAAAEGPAAARPGQAISRLGLLARPWLQAVPVTRVTGWTSQRRAELRFGAPSDRGTLEACLRGSVWNLIGILLDSVHRFRTKSACKQKCLNRSHYRLASTYIFVNN